MKKKVGVLFGGQSGEHEVSCVSAYNILEHINKDDYEVVPIGITKSGVWNIYTGDIKNIENGNWKEDKENLKEDIDVFSDLSDIDVFFPVLHGPMGEDGTVQGVFEMLNKPYVGCGVLASSVGMDKILSKIAFESAGIPTGQYLPVSRFEYQEEPEEVIERIIEKLELPVFIKPANMGSSVGITKAHDRDELIEALDTAFKYDRRVIAEAFVDGREIECAVLQENGKTRAATPGEIIPAKEFYDYEAKYASDGKSISVIPAEISQEALDEIKKLAVRAFEVIDGSGLSRVDFFYNDKTGGIYINEINTLPGFTPISMYPMMWQNSGIEYNDLISRLIESADTKRTFLETR